MDRTIFYTPDILVDFTLPQEESAHCVRVLRMQEGDKIYLTDGKGYFYDAEIAEAHQKHCRVNILQTIESPRQWNFGVHIAFAPTKNMDRVEWFAEKATEIGIDRFSPILTAHSERKVLKNDRLSKILVSAMKQSQKAILPQLDELIGFEAFVKQDFDGQKFIAHCYDSEKQPLAKAYQPNSDALILIGPEGDFSEQEVDTAVKHGFIPISLGESRLRTETAALVACHTLHVLNYK